MYFVNWALYAQYHEGKPVVVPGTGVVDAGYSVCSSVVLGGCVGVGSVEWPMASSRRSVVARSCGVGS
jgi:hypothetical protein